MINEKQNETFPWHQTPPGQTLNPLHSSKNHMAPASLSRLPCCQTHSLLKPKAGKKQKGSFHLTNCVILLPAICKSCSLCPERFSSIKSPSTCPSPGSLPCPSLDWAGECSPTPGPPHPHVHLPLSQWHLIPLSPLDARHLRAEAML